MGTPRSTSKAKPQDRSPEEQPSTPETSDTPTTDPPISHGAEWVWTTPQMAQDILAHNDVNRDMRSHDLDSYIRMMNDGNWGVCVEPIIRDVKGNLVNGQHRLHSSVATGTSHWWLMLDDAPTEVQKTVNAGARARLADVLKYNGETNYVVLAGIVNGTYLWSHDLLGSSSKTQPLEGELWLDAHPDIRHSCDLGRHVSSTSVIDLGPIVLGTAHWIIAQSNGTYEADRFLTRMSQLQNEGAGSPIIALLNRMHKGNIEKTGKPPIRDQISVVIKVWNFDVEGRFTRRIIIGTRTGWQQPIPLKKDNPMSEKEFLELPKLPAVDDVIPPNEDIVDEGEEPV